MKKIIIVTRGDLRKAQESKPNEDLSVHDFKIERIDIIEADFIIFDTEGKWIKLKERSRNPEGYSLKRTGAEIVEL